MNTRQLLERYQKDGLVFKSCHTYIVVLHKLRDTKTNEERKFTIKIEPAIEATNLE